MGSVSIGLVTMCCLYVPSLMSLIFFKPTTRLHSLYNVGSIFVKSKLRKSTMQFMYYCLGSEDRCLWCIGNALIFASEHSGFDPPQDVLISGNCMSCVHILNSPGLYFSTCFSVASIWHLTYPGLVSFTQVHTWCIFSSQV